MFHRVLRNHDAETGGGGSLATPSRQDRIRGIQTEIESRYGLSLQPDFVAAVTDLALIYNRLSKDFSSRGVNEVAFQNRRAVLTDAQRTILEQEGPGLRAEIEVVSQRIRHAGEKLGPLPMIGESPSPLIQAHAEFTRSSLSPELTESAFGLYRLSQNPAVKTTGQIVSVAILLRDKFLRDAVLAVPEIQTLVDKMPIDPTTLTGTIVEDSLLNVPVAADYKQRLGQALTLKSQFLKDPNLVGKTASDHLVFVNAPCGVGIEDALLIGHFGQNPRLAQTQLVLADLFPQALHLTTARINVTLGTAAYKPEISIGQVDLGQLHTRVFAQKDFTPVLAGEQGGADYFFVGGLSDYFTQLQRRGLLAATALSLRPGAYGHMTQIDKGHPHRVQQYFIVDWTLNYLSADEMASLGHTLHSDLAELRRIHENIPHFDGNFRSDITDMGVLALNPGMLKPGEFCVARYIEPGTGRLGTHLNLVFRMNE